MEAETCCESSVSQVTDKVDYCSQKYDAVQPRRNAP